MSKRVGATLAAAVVCSVATLGCEPQQFLNILTGGTSGVYYPMGVGLSQLYRRALPEMRLSVQATRASAENLHLLQARRGELGFTLGDALSDAWRGNDAAGFSRPLTRLRVVAGIYPNYIQIVASADAGIRTLADLAGKRISVGAPGSGTELNARAILGAAGFTYEDFSKVEYLAFGESVELMKNRQLDITLQSAGLGVASLRDLAIAVPVVVVPIPADVVHKTGSSAYQAASIPADTYPGQTDDVPTATIQNFLVTHEEVSDEVVYIMTKTLFENLDELVAAHTAAREITLEHAIGNTPVPLHPGAARYYREVGLIQ